MPCGEGVCHESSEMESGSWRNCCQSGLNPTILIYGDKPESKFDDDDMAIVTLCLFFVK